jgi:hypothetical protein
MMFCYNVRRCVFAVCFFGIIAGLFLKPVSAQTKHNIISWGENISSWNGELGVAALREGCSIVPTSCEPYLDNLANLSGAKTYYVSFPFEVSTAVSWAKQYSTLSLSHKMMVEIGFDDFVNKIEDAQIDGTLPDPATFVSSVIAATKSANPNLAFGVTIYEDGLTHAVLTNSVLPAALRAQIQYVHLYVHYREDAPNYAANVATAKSIFPNAKIIAGAYPYDRIEYLPCAFKGTVACTAAQEQSLYRQLLQTQMSMLNAGTVYGVEFFFGYFGDPEDWEGWTTQARACSTARLAQCYANSLALQNISVQVVQSAGTSTGSAAVSLSHTSLYMGTEIVGKQSTPGTVVLKNTGIGALAISNIAAAGKNSPDFPMTENCPLSLAAGASCTLTIYFKPGAAGARSGEILITDNAGSGSQAITLTGTATSSSGGTPVVSLAHTSLYMGAEIVGKKSTPAILIMKNTGTAALAISGISVGGTNSADFPMTQNCGTTLPAGTGCTITIYFKPSTTGTRSGSIVIKDNATGGSQTVTLTGTGQA